MKRSKFTLIELLVSLLIMAMVMVAIWQVMIGILQSRKYIEEDYQPTKAGNATLHLLLQEIRYAHKFYIMDLPISEEEDKKFSANKRSTEKGDEYLMLFNGELTQVGDISPSRIEMYSASPLYDPRKGSIPSVSKVVYNLEPYTQNGEDVTDRFNLIRAAVEASPRFSEHGEPQVVLSSSDMTGFSVYKGIRLLKIQYYNGSEWLDVWTTSSEKDVPLAVRVDLVVNASKLEAEPLPVIAYKGYESELELSRGDIRLKGMVKILSNNSTSSENKP